MTPLSKPTLRWSRAQPKVPGTYWFRIKNDLGSRSRSRWNIGFTHVGQTVIHGESRLYTRFPQEWLFGATSITVGIFTRHKGIQWAGPMAYPKGVTYTESSP